VQINRHENKERPTPQATSHNGNTNSPTRKQRKANAISKQPKGKANNPKKQNRERPTPQANKQKKNKKGAPKKLRCAFQAKPKTKNLKPE
jgi:hypothetical protein